MNPFRQSSFSFFHMPIQKREIFLVKPISVIKSSNTLNSKHCANFHNFPQFFFCMLRYEPTYSWLRYNNTLMFKLFSASRTGDLLTFNSSAISRSAIWSPFLYESPQKSCGVGNPQYSDSGFLVNNLCFLIHKNPSICLVVYCRPQ